MMKEVRSIDATFPKPDKPDEYYGWTKVTAMLDPVYARIPSMDAAFSEVFKAPKPLTAAFLIDQYFADHYHNYRMQHRILDFLGRGDFGKAPLPIFEELLATTGPDEPNTVTGLDFGRAVTAGRAILGDSFPAWYRSVRGIDYFGGASQFAAALRGGEQDASKSRMVARNASMNARNIQILLKPLP